MVEVLHKDDMKRDLPKRIRSPVVSSRLTCSWRRWRITPFFRSWQGAGKSWHGRERRWRKTVPWKLERIIIRSWTWSPVDSIYRAVKRAAAGMEDDLQWRGLNPREILFYHGAEATANPFIGVSNTWCAWEDVGTLGKKQDRYKNVFSKNAVQAWRGYPSVNIMPYDQIEGEIPTTSCNLLHLQEARCPCLRLFLLYFCWIVACACKRVTMIPHARSMEPPR